MSKVIILSGAGISAESGIPTFRDSDGLWEEYDIKKVCYKGCLETNRKETIEFYDKRRKELENIEPNKAHKVIAELKNKYPDEIEIITQNVDDLFEKAGVKDIIHLHGFLREVKCEKCGVIYDIGYQKIEDAFNGKCPVCFSDKIRPNIVMFAEQAPEYIHLSSRKLKKSLLVVIGTSGNVIDINYLAKKSKRAILNNLEQSDVISEYLFNKTIYKPATEAIDEIKDYIEKYLLDNKSENIENN